MLGIGNSCPSIYSGDRTLFWKDTSRIILLLHVIIVSDEFYVYFFEVIMRKKIGQILIELGLITEKQLDHALTAKKTTKKRLGEVLIELGFVTESDISSAISKKLNIPIVDCSAYEISNDLMRIIPRQKAFEKLIFPIEKRDNTIILAMADPLDYTTIDETSFRAKLEVLPVVSYKQAILKAIERNYSDTNDSDNLIDIYGDAIDSLGVKAEISEKDIQFLSTEDIESSEESDISAEALHLKSKVPKVVNFVTKIILMAAKKQASDIHIEPQEKYIQVRFRIDGELQNILRYKKETHSSIVSRIKIISDMDITNRRTPQDGSALVSFQGQEIDLRVSTLPSVYGEKIVIRLLNRGAGIVSLEDLGMPNNIKNSVVELLKQPQGMFIVTGPTGSGKTTTLYACLNYIRSETINIVTIEDPVEYRLKGITQVSVNEAVGRTFASVLRSFFRQDPDIIKIGEIRDLETAEIAIKSALTGHLVLTTLHTNNTIATITRLIDIGIPSYLVSSAVRGILAQRLVRKICNRCKVTSDPSYDRLDDITGLIPSSSGLSPHTKIYYGAGCQACSNTGYSGRIAIYEYLLISPALKKLISQNASEEDLFIAAKNEGATFLFEDAINKVKAGITTIDEVIAKIPMSIV